MPRIPTHQYNEDWDNEDYDTDHDYPQDRSGRRVTPFRNTQNGPDQDEQSRERWRKQRRNLDY